MKHLYFMRHGEAELNVQRRYAGHIDTPLTERGRQQAMQAAQGTHPHEFELLVSSPLNRAYETAKIVAEAIGYPPEEIVTHELFMERSWGKLEGEPYQDDALVGPEHGAEPESALDERARAALDYLRTLDAEVILLIGHGSFSASLRRVIDPTADTSELPNAHIVQLL